MPIVEQTNSNEQTYAPEDMIPRNWRDPLFLKPPSGNARGQLEDKLGYD